MKVKLRLFMDDGEVTLIISGYKQAIVYVCLYTHVHSEQAKYGDRDRQYFGICEGQIRAIGRSVEKLCSHCFPLSKCSCLLNKPEIFA